MSSIVSYLEDTNHHLYAFTSHSQLVAQPVQFVVSQLNLIIKTVSKMLHSNKMRSNREAVSAWTDSNLTLVKVSFLTGIALGYSAIYILFIGHDLALFFRLLVTPKHGVKKQQIKENMVRLRVRSAARTSADSQPTKLRGVFFCFSTFFEGGEGSTSLERGNRVSCCLIITVISFWI